MTMELQREALAVPNTFASIPELTQPSEQIQDPIGTPEVSTVPEPLLVDGSAYPFHAYVGTTSGMKHEERIIADNSGIVYATLHFSGMGRIVSADEGHRISKDAFYLNPAYTDQDVASIFGQLEAMYPDFYGTGVRGYFSSESASRNVKDAIRAAGINIPGDRAEG
jgi:hypothetical protein